jgi:hypothetical protein
MLVTDIRVSRNYIIGRKKCGFARGKTGRRLEIPNKFK